MLMILTLSLILNTMTLAYNSPKDSASSTLQRFVRKVSSVSNKDMPTPPPMPQPKKKKKKKKKKPVVSKAVVDEVEEEEVEDHRWEEAVDSVAGAKDHVACLDKLSQTVELDDFNDFLADDSRITKHNAIIEKVENLYVQILVDAKGADKSLKKAWQESRNYMVVLQNAYLKYLSVRCHWLTRILTTHTHTHTHTHARHRF